MVVILGDVVAGEVQTVDERAEQTSWRYLRVWALSFSMQVPLCMRRTL